MRTSAIMKAAFSVALGFSVVAAIPQIGFTAGVGMRGTNNRPVISPAVRSQAVTLRRTAIRRSMHRGPAVVQRTVQTLGRSGRMVLLNPTPDPKVGVGISRRSAGPKVLGPTLVHQADPAQAIRTSHPETFSSPKTLREAVLAGTNVSPPKPKPERPVGTLSRPLPEVLNPPEAWMNPKTGPPSFEDPTAGFGVPQLGLTGFDSPNQGGLGSSPSGDSPFGPQVPEIGLPGGWMPLRFGKLEGGGPPSGNLGGSFGKVTYMKFEDHEVVVGNDNRPAVKAGKKAAGDLFGGSSAKVEHIICRDHEVVVGNDNRPAVKAGKKAAGGSKSGGGEKKPPQAKDKEDPPPPQKNPSHCGGPDGVDTDSGKEYQRKLSVWAEKQAGGWRLWGNAEFKNALKEYLRAGKPLNVYGGSASGNKTESGDTGLYELIADLNTKLKGGMAQAKNYGKAVIIINPRDGYEKH